MHAMISVCTKAGLLSIQGRLHAMRGCVECVQLLLISQENPDCIFLVLDLEKSILQASVVMQTGVK
jgi:hypothetical protein